MIEGAKESYQEVTRKEVEGASKRAVQKVRKDTGMKVWVIKLLTVCLGTAGAWWAEQTVTTATTGDRWRGGFWGRRYPGDGRNGGKSSVNVRKLGGGVKCRVGDVVEIKTSRSNRI